MWVAYGFGYGQSWKDETASRMVGVTYTNLTGKPILVSVRTAIAWNALCVIVVNGLMFANTYAGTLSYQTNTALVPTGGTYSVWFSPGSVEQWLEFK